jgi:hypothetical protein
MSTRRSEEEWVDFASSLLREAIREHHALAEPELISRLVDRRLVDELETPSPHHVTQARNRLVRREELKIDTERTRGGRVVSILVRGDRTRNAKAIDTAVARKRLLMARYYGWTQGTAATGPGLAGPEGERVAELTLRASGIGAVLTNPTAGTLPGLKHFLGAEVPAGALDNGVLMNPLTPDGELRSTTQIALPIEVKNIREWVYPHAQELHQLLFKAAVLKSKLPDVLIVPLLICRRAHITTLYMAKRMGFFVAETQKHYFPTHSRIDVAAFAEVRSELALLDMVQENSVCSRLLGRLVTIQRYYDAESAAYYWGLISGSADVLQTLEALYREGTTLIRRRRINDLRRQVAELGIEGGW